MFTLLLTQAALFTEKDMMMQLLNHSADPNVQLAASFEDFPAGCTALHIVSRYINKAETNS